MTKMRPHYISFTAFCRNYLVEVKDGNRFLLSAAMVLSLPISKMRIRSWRPQGLEVQRTKRRRHVVKQSSHAPDPARRIRVGPESNVGSGDADFRRGALFSGSRSSTRCRLTIRERSPSLNDCCSSCLISVVAVICPCHLLLSPPSSVIVVVCAPYRYCT